MNINKLYTENKGLIFQIVIICIVFWFGRSCGKSKEIIEPLIVTETHYSDTIFPKDTIISFKDKPVPYPVYVDTNKYRPIPIDSLDMHRFFTYKDSTEDLNVKIYSEIHTQGKTLKYFKPSYKLKVPLIIKDSVVIKKDSLIYVPYKYEIHGGIIVSPSMIAPTIDLSINKGTYGLGYDPFKKQIVVTAKYRLFGWTPKKRK